MWSVLPGVSAEGTNARTVFAGGAAQKKTGPFLRSFVFLSSFILLFLILLGIDECLYFFGIFFIFGNADERCEQIG